MTKISFSDAGIRSLPPPAKGQASYWDNRFPTFGLRISQGGSKTFVVNRGNSLITIGRFPILGLSDARAEAKRLLAEFTLGKLRPQVISYTVAVEQFIAEKRKNRRPLTIEDYSRRLRRVRFTDHVANINHAEVARQLSRITAPSEYNHVLVALRVFFNWAIKRTLRTDNPTTGLSKNAAPSRDRVLTDDELKAVWIAAGQMEGRFGTIVKLLMLTAQRRGEIAALHLSYYSHNQQTICLPKELTKNGREHTFPAGNTTASLLQPLLPASGLFFPARGKPDKPFNGWSKSKRALDKSIISCCEKNGLEDWPTINPWTLHDLRRTVATNMAAMGVLPHVVERLLNHVSGEISGVGLIYNRATYLPEMAIALQLWEAKLQKLIA